MLAIVDPGAPTVLSALAVLLLVSCAAPETAVAPAVAPKTATHYFYWYRWPREHFPAGRAGAEGHLHHFVQPEKVDYQDPAWHRGEFARMAACGIDIALPVYWGAPGAYDRPSIAFSRKGLGPMVAALDGLAKRGEKAVTLGLFYDTSTLLNDVRGAAPRGGRADLTTLAGKELFAGTVTDFFAAIPPRFWARLDGRPLVVLYSAGFAKASDGTLGASLRRAFAQRFGPREKAGVFLVADASWGDIGQDLTTRWGAALAGPHLFPGVAQVGPGYDDSPVPGRRTPSRDREGGNFYRWSWRRAIASRPRLVLLETWNEMHEGTEICPTQELGTLYLDLTKEYIGRLHRGEPGPEVVLLHSEVQLRPDRSWGAEATGAVHVHVDYSGARPVRLGLREIPWEDGRLRVRDAALRPHLDAAAVSYLYFQVADAFRFDVDDNLEIVVELDAPIRELSFEHDSRDASATLAGAYTRARSEAHASPDGRSRAVFALPRARLGNRQNGGADFRFVVRDPAIAIRRVDLRRARPR